MEITFANTIKIVEEKCLVAIINITFSNIYNVTMGTHGVIFFVGSKDFKSLFTLNGSGFRLPLAMLLSAFKQACVACVNCLVVLIVADHAFQS